MIGIPNLSIEKKAQNDLDKQDMYSLVINNGTQKAIDFMRYIK